MGADEVNAFLSHLAVEGKVSASTQAQALSALVFLYRNVLDNPLPWIDDIIRARRKRKLPVVLTREEVSSLLAAMQCTPRLVAAILCRGGLCLLEALRLRAELILRALEAAKSPEVVAAIGRGLLENLLNATAEIRFEVATELMNNKVSSGIRMR